MIFEVSLTPRGSSDAPKTYRVELTRSDHAASWKCQINGKEIVLEVVLKERDVLSLISDGRSYQIFNDPALQELSIGGTRYSVQVSDPRSYRGRRAATGAGDGPRKISANMPGKVVRVLLAEGAKVEAGQGVVVIEAMKMQNELKSPKAGTIKKLHVHEGAAVKAGDVLAIVE